MSRRRITLVMDLTFRLGTRGKRIKELSRRVDELESVEREWEAMTADRDAFQKRAADLTRAIGEVEDELKVSTELRHVAEGRVETLGSELARVCKVAEAAEAKLADIEAAARYCLWDGTGKSIIGHIRGMGEHIATLEANERKAKEALAAPARGEGEKLTGLTGEEAEAAMRAGAVCMDAECDVLRLVGGEWQMREKGNWANIGDDRWSLNSESSSWRAPWSIVPNVGAGEASNG